MLCRLCAVSLVFSLVSGAGLASNRADVNADGFVDAEDLSVLGNILAGNIDAAGYDMASVVVVAKQGGDFDDPADAADWVTSQAPSTSNRFAILVMPGYYNLDRAVDLPSYTVLAGVDRQTCVFVCSIEGAEAGVVVIDGEVVVTVRNLTLFNTTVTHLSSSNTRGVFVRSSNVVLIQDVKIQVAASGGNASGAAFLWFQENHNSVYMEDCIVDVTSYNDPQSNLTKGVTNSGGKLMLRNCTIEAEQRTMSKWVSGIYQNDPDPNTDAMTQAFGCTVLPVSKTAGYEAYFERSGVGATYGFFHCVVAGTAIGAPDLILAYCCDPDGVPVP